MIDVGVTWPAEMEYLEGPASSGYEPRERDLRAVARTLGDAASRWRPDLLSPREFVRMAVSQISPDLGFAVSRPRVGDVTRREAALVRAVYRLPAGEVVLNVDDVSDPRVLAETAVRLVAIVAATQVLPRMRSAEFASTARRAADSTAEAVMGIYDELGPPRHLPTGDTPERGH